MLLQSKTLPLLGITIGSLPKGLLAFADIDPLASLLTTAVIALVI